MSKTLRVDCFTVDLTAGQLFKRSARIHLRDQSFQVLAALLERPGEVITREELRRRLWPSDVFVDFENSLNTAVARLREALGDSALRPRFIETLPRRGYRLIAPVTEAPGKPTSAAPRLPRLLVLPFANWTGEADKEFLADAVTDEIITALAALAPERLAVIARTTAMHCKETRKPLAVLARDLGLDYVVEGGLRGDGGALTLNVQLIRVSDETHVWAKRFDVDPASLFRIQNALAREVGEQLAVLPTANGARARHGPSARPGDLEACTLYERGRQHLARGAPQDFAAAKQCFERALERDSRFALAYDALAELHWYLGFLGVVPPKSVTSTGLFYALRALDCDDRLAETHALVALYRKEFDYNWDDVKRAMDRAREVNPASPIVRLRYAMGWLLPECRLDEAITEIETALETDPLSAFMRAWLGCMLWLDRRYERAVEQARSMIDIEPDSFLGHWTLGMYLRESGEYDESIAAHRRALELSGGSMLMLGWLGLALGQAGRGTEARQVLDQLQAALDGGAYVPPTSVAWTALGLGRIDDAFTWMDRAAEMCDPMIMPIQSYPFLDAIRIEARYEALLRRLKMRRSAGVLLEAVPS